MPLAKVAASAEPAVPYDVLAAQIDLAESESFNAEAGVQGWGEQRCISGAGEVRDTPGRRCIQPEFWGHPYRLELARFRLF